jgi:hypothetical protein
VVKELKSDREEREVVVAGVGEELDISLVYL